MSAMRFASNFFASLPNFKLEQHRHVFQIDIPKHWTWFFLNRNQLFLFLQDPVHLVTKWRNRLLSTTADLYFGNDKISIKHIEDLIDNPNCTKLDHGLTRSDINPRDRQNYHSCIKLLSDDVFNLLTDDANAKGTVVYLKLLKMIVKAYIDRSTPIAERKPILKTRKIINKIYVSIINFWYVGIQSAWCVLIVCRIWWCYLEIMANTKSSKSDQVTSGRKKQINRFFITRPAYLSIELNAQNLLYLVLLVKQNRLPKQALNNIHLFNSQACESLFRDARALTGTFSTKVNFSVKDFLRRSQKISMLNGFKYSQSEDRLSFPVHHKQKREQSSTSMNPLDDIDKLDIEHLISNAYDQAVHIVEHSRMFSTLKKHNLNNLIDISRYIFNILKKNSKLIDYSLPTETDTMNEFGLDEENDDNDEITDVQDQPIGEDLLDCVSESDTNEDEILNSTKSDFNGIRIVDNINPSLRHSYFKIKINGHIKYLHKQSACWLLSSNNTRLSSDRLSRVQQQTFDLD